MYSTRLVSKQCVVADIWSFRFEVPHGFSWHGGQHVVVILEHEGMDDRGNSRALSIATAPHEKVLQFITHCPDQGSSFKRALKALPISGTITITPAEDSFQAGFGDGPTTLLVGGVGMTTIRAVLMDRDHAGKALPDTLMYYAPAGQHLFKTDLDGLAARHPEFSVHYVVSEDLKEKGGIKEVEQRPDATYVFSGVYTREMLAHGEIAGRVAGPETDERKEVELLSKVTGLLE